MMEILFYLMALSALAYPLGIYMAWVLECRWTTPLERVFYRLSGVTTAEEQDWKGYAKGMLLFNLLGFGAVYLLQRLQAMLPLNPENLPAVPGVQHGRVLCVQRTRDHPDPGDRIS